MVYIFFSSPLTEMTSFKYLSWYNVAKKKKEKEKKERKKKENPTDQYSALALMYILCWLGLKPLLATLAAKITFSLQMPEVGIECVPTGTDCLKLEQFRV